MVIIRSTQEGVLVLQNVFCPGSFCRLVSTRQLFRVVCCFFFCLVSLSVFRLVVEIVALRDFHQVSFIEGLPLLQWDPQLRLVADELSDEGVGGVSTRRQTAGTY